MAMLSDVSSDQNPRTVAQQTWRRMFGFFMHTRPQRDGVLDRLGLTPNDAKALHSLDPDQGRTMRELAGEWGCDASTATWIVGRLERLDLVRRSKDPRDGRVRRVLLTAAGTTTRTELREGLDAVPPELLTLDVDSLRALRDIFEKLPPHEDR